MKVGLFFKIFLGLVILPFVFMTTFLYLEKKGLLNIDHIEVIIDNSSEQEHYLQPLIQDLNQQLESCRGQSLWKVELPQLSALLSQFPWVEEFSISRHWPAKLQVNVRVKKIDFLLMTANGKFIPIAESGESLPTIELKQIPDVIVLRGENFEKQPELRKKAVKILKEIPLSGPFSQKTISEIYYDDRDGFWMTLVKKGIQVKIGQDQVLKKSTRVSQALEYIESRNLDVRVIDANLSKKVLVRLRKGL